MCIPNLEASRASSPLFSPRTIRDLLPVCSSIQVLLWYHCSLPGLYSLGLCQQNLIFHICEKNMKIKLNSPLLLHGLRVTDPLSNKGKEALSKKRDSLTRAECSCVQRNEIVDHCWCCQAFGISLLRARERGILPAWKVLGLGDGGTSASPDASR